MPDNDRLSRRTFLKASGGVAGVAAVAGCGQNGDDGDDGTDNGTDDGTDDGTNGEPDRVYAEFAPKAQQAWERIEANPGPDAQDVRDEAHVEIEEAIRDDMVLLPLYHRLTERFWYDWVDIEPSGALGSHRQKLNEVTVDTDSQYKDSNELDLINSTISSLDPIQSTDTASARVIRQVYEGLTQYPNGVQEIENDLAEEVEISDDARTYTFTIKEGVEYHNGDELTADDFVYAWRRLAESENSQRANFILEPGFLHVEHEVDDEDNVEPDSIAVEAVDDYTIEMTLAEAQPAALDILAYDSFAAVPEGYVGDIEGYDGEVDHDEFSTETMVGTGPFEFGEWVPEDEARVERFDGYHGAVAEVDAVNWEIIEDDNAIWTYVNERNADVFGIPTAMYEPENVDAGEPDDLGRETGTYGPLDNGDTVNYLGVAELTIFYVAWNAPQVPRSVRQAVAHVTDHEELIAEVFKERGVEAFSFLPPALWPGGQSAYEDYVDEWPYGRNETDRDGAREVLEADGFTEDDPFEMTLTTYASEVFQEFGRLTRDKLDGLGVNLQLEEAEFSTLISRGEDGDLEFYSLGWIWSWADPAYGHYGFEPMETDTDRMPGEVNGYYLDWDDFLDEQ